MARPLLEDDLWAAMELLLPPDPPRPKGGRKRIPNRQVLTGILFVLRSAIPWELLPKEMGCGSGMTCWRRLKQWQEAGVWKRIHLELLDWLGEEDQIDWSRAALDSASVPAKRGVNLPDRIQRTAQNRARSAMLWSSAPASPWRRSSRQRTRTTARSLRK